MVTGPLHEAFAEQFSDEPEAGIVISRKPPEAIDEIPPEYRPDGQDIVWIPGYWGWDPEREDFIWITGIWRQAPPIVTGCLDIGPKCLKAISGSLASGRSAKLKRFAICHLRPSLCR